MKTAIKLLLAIAFFTATSFGAQKVGSNLTATNTVIITNACVATSFTFFSTNATPTIVRLFDGDLTYVTGAYTNYTAASTSKVTSFVTVNGTTNLSTNTVIQLTASAHAAATNTLVPIAVFVVPAANVPITIEPDSGIAFASKLNLSNNLAGLSYVISYRGETVSP